VTEVPETELVLATSDGLRLVGRAWLPTGAPRGCVVVVHGLKDHGGRYSELAGALRDQGLGTFAFDLRGHGRSAGRRSWVPRFDCYVDDLELVIAEARRRVPDRPLFLLGHSMGGAIVTRYAIERSPSVAGVVLSAPALQRPATTSGAAVALVRLLGTLAPGAAVFRLNNPDFSRDPAVVSAMGNDPLIDQRPATARLAAELLGTMERLRATSPQFALPLLALHGSADRLTHPDGSRRLVDLARSTDKTFRLYPGLFHDLLHEPERATVCSEIVAWITARLGTAAA